MKLYALIEERILKNVSLALPKATGELIDTMACDPIYEERPILDEDGKDTGKTVSVFVGFTKPYPVQVPELQGGYCWLGNWNGWLYLLLTGSNATMVQLENDFGAAFVPIMKWPDLETFEDRANTRIATSIRKKLNEWRVSVSKEDLVLDEYPNTILNEEALQDTLNLFTPGINILEFSIMASKD